MGAPTPLPPPTDRPIPCPTPSRLPARSASPLASAPARAWSSKRSAQNSLTFQTGSTDSQSRRPQALSSGYHKNGLGPTNAGGGRARSGRGPRSHETESVAGSNRQSSAYQRKTESYQRKTTSWQSASTSCDEASRSRGGRRCLRRVYSRRCPWLHVYFAQPGFRTRGRGSSVSRSSRVHARRAGRPYRRPWPARPGPSRADPEPRPTLGRARHRGARRARDPRREKPARQVWRRDSPGVTADATPRARKIRRRPPRSSAAAVAPSLGRN